ncbi:MAG: DEAD/DEAH box helicase, partial [Actinobacteria bacterium]
MLDFLLKIGKKNKKIKNLGQELSLPFHISAGVSSSARAYTISLIAKTTNRAVIVIAIDDGRACELAAEVNHFFPANHLPNVQIDDTPQVKSKYLNGLNSLKKGSEVVCLGSEILSKKILAPKKISKSISLKINQELKLTSLAKKLVTLGYSREYQVDSPAQFSIRGNICDIYPTLQESPVRVEYFGDSIEEIRNFDPFNQRSHNILSDVTIAPCSFEDEPTAGLKDYLSEKHLLIFEDFSLVENKCDCDLSFIDNKAILDLTLLSKESQKVDLGFEKLEFSAGQFEQIHNFLKEKQSQGYLTVINIQEEGKRARFKEMLLSWRFFSEELRRGLAIIKPLILLTTHKIENSFVWPEEKIAVLSDKDIFIRQLQKLPPKLHSGHVRISSFEDLKLDDYVVHISHGIAKYEGLETREIDNVKREYLKLGYAGRDKLLVPVSEMDRVSRYIGAGEKEPQISKLDSNKWNLTKKKVKKSVRKLAVNLLELFARRNQAKGLKFSKDTPWQRQLEDDFPFEETEGQMSAIDEVKHDLEQYKPMDRLICGDVGYGKTEVALRAAFKVVQDSKQVLFLVPTTILAQQHYKTLTSRLNPYPVIIQVLSRFKSKSEQQKIANDFNHGKVDILIGTHRLLQKDIKPKSLGLIVVDEEQRFGVNHKEKLKTLKTDVDILTLSATPIPRTLQMALSGIRDLSVIETPPDNRHPVITHVGPYKSELAVNSIKKELKRGGQVFYLYNEVQSIDSVVDKLR